MSEPIDERLGLAESIASLRSELVDAMAAGGAEDLQFEVGEIELQLQLTAERSKEASAGVRFWVVNAEGRLGATESVTHSLRIGLTPRLASGAPVLTERD